MGSQATRSRGAEVLNAPSACAPRHAPPRRCSFWFSLLLSLAYWTFFGMQNVHLAPAPELAKGLSGDAGVLLRVADLSTRVRLLHERAGLRNGCTQLAGLQGMHG